MWCLRPLAGVASPADCVGVASQTDCADMFPQAVAQVVSLADISGAVGRKNKKTGDEPGAVRR